MHVKMNYCPACGHDLADREAFGRVRRVCPACGFIFFREPKVAAGALVQRDGQVALVRRAVVPRKGFWALPAGYMEYDERPDEAAAREVVEETGLRVAITGVLDVYPMESPHGRGIIVVYWACWLAGELTPDDDVSDARWFGPEALPDPLAFDSTVSALRRWQASVGDFDGSLLPDLKNV